MSKAAKTKAKIIQQAADLFNQRGYAGASIADIMAVTGLKKGGIYNHFTSKDELALAAFDFAVQQVSQRYWQAVKQHRHAIARLQAILDAFVTAPDEIPLKGGCPLLNTAIESDDTHPILRQRTQQAMDRWRSLIARIVAKGMKAGDVASTVDPDRTAAVMIATLEGALMMAQLYGDRKYLQYAKDHLTQYIDSLKPASDSS